MCSTINHPDQCEEKGCHQTVRDHLDDGTVHCSLVHHQNGKQYKSAMANRRVGVNIFKVILNNCRECTIYDTDRSKNNENPGLLMSSFRHEEYCNTESSVTAQFHQNDCMKHRNCCRCRCVTIG